MDNIIIFGAGKWGRLADCYYASYCNVSCFVDNNQEKWGTFLNGKEVVSPEILRGFQGRVVIAVQKGSVQIEEELKAKYGICNFLEFEVHQRGKYIEEKQDFNVSCVVMEYAGGMGNQLFQFALAKLLEYRGCAVMADITHYSYINMRRFELDRIFRNCHFKYASNEMREYFVMKDSVSKMENLGKRYVYIEPDVYHCEQYSVSEEWGRIKRGIVQGYFQTYLFADEIRDILLECLEFPKTNDKRLHLLAEEIRGCNSVSIHIRRGDYLAESERRIEGICDMEYYSNAIQMIMESVKDAHFYFFSDDVFWCMKNIRIDGAVYLNSELFERYEDWYDMYLMSQCKHNIIANSSFSWWGAWFNQNQDKIVIAPRKWDNYCEMLNICPSDWKRI